MRPQSGLIAGAVLAAALLLGACGGSSGSAGSPGSGPASAAPAAGNVDGSAPPTVAAPAQLDAQSTTAHDQPIVYPKAKPAQVSSTIVQLEPGQETGWHKNNVPTYIYVMEGTLTVEYDAGVTKEFPEGTAFVQATRVFHNGKNTGSGTLRFLEVHLGAKGVADTVVRKQ